MRMARIVVLCFMFLVLLPSLSFAFTLCSEVENCTGTCNGVWCNGTDSITFDENREVAYNHTVLAGVGVSEPIHIQFKDIAYYGTDLTSMAFWIDDTDITFTAGASDGNTTIDCIWTDKANPGNQFTSNMYYQRFPFGITLIRFNSINNFSGGFGALTGNKEFDITHHCNFTAPWGITTIDRSSAGGDCSGVFMTDDHEITFGNTVGGQCRRMNPSALLATAIPTASNIQIRHDLQFTNDYVYNVSSDYLSYLNVQRRSNLSNWTVALDGGAYIINDTAADFWVNYTTLRFINNVSILDGTLDFPSFQVGYEDIDLNLLESVGAPINWEGVYTAGNPWINATSDWYYDNETIEVEYELTNLTSYVNLGGWDCANPVNWAVCASVLTTPPDWWIEFDMVNNTTQQTLIDSYGGAVGRGGDATDGLVTAYLEGLPVGAYRVELWGSYNLIGDVDILGGDAGNAIMFSSDYFYVISDENRLYWPQGESADICDDVLVVQGWAFNTSYLEVLAPNSTYLGGNISFANESVVWNTPINMSNSNFSGTWTASLKDAKNPQSDRIIFDRIRVVGQPIFDNEVIAKPPRVYLGESVIIQTRSTESGLVSIYDSEDVKIRDWPVDRCISERFYNITINDTELYYSSGTWTLRLFHRELTGLKEVANGTFIVSYGDRPTTATVQRDVLKGFNNFAENTLTLRGEAGKMLIVMVVTSMLTIGVLSKGGLMLGMVTAGMSIGFFTMLGFVGPWLMMLVVLALLAMAVPNITQMLGGG